MTEIIDYLRIHHVPIAHAGRSMPLGCYLSTRADEAVTLGKELYRLVRFVPLCGIVSP